MRIRDAKSIIIISLYLLGNAFIIGTSLLPGKSTITSRGQTGNLAPEYTIIEELDYFHLKNGLPQMSLAAGRMQSLGQESADFEGPQGVYNYKQKNKTIRYSADTGHYQKRSKCIGIRWRGRNLI